MRKLLWTALAVLFLVASPVGGGTQVKPLIPVHVGVITSSTNVAMYIAAANGYFKDEGLDVTIQSFPSGPDIILPMSTGEIDVGGGASSASLFNALGRGAGIKIVADKGSNPPNQAYNAIFIRKDLIDSGRFKKPADIAGMTVGMAGIAATGQALVDYFIEGAGLDWQRAHVHVITLPSPDLLLALQNKSIDAMFAFEPYVTLAKRQDLGKVYMADKITPSLEGGVLLYSAKFAADRPVADAYMRAYLHGARVYNAALSKDGHLTGPGSDPIVKMLSDVLNIKDETLVRQMVPGGVSATGKLDKASMMRDANFYKAIGMLTGTDSVDDVFTKAIDTSFAADANAALAKTKR